jgi:hypothetical protein
MDTPCPPSNKRVCLAPTSSVLSLFPSGFDQRTRDLVPTGPAPSAVVAAKDEYGHDCELFLPPPSFTTSEPPLTELVPVLDSLTDRLESCRKAMLTTGTHTDTLDYTLTHWITH